MYYIMLVFLQGLQRVSLGVVCKCVYKTQDVMSSAKRIIAHL